MFQVKLSTALFSFRPFRPSFSASRVSSSWKSIPATHKHTPELCVGSRFHTWLSEPVSCQTDPETNTACLQGSVIKLSCLWVCQKVDLHIYKSKQTSWHLHQQLKVRSRLRWRKRLKILFQAQKIILFFWKRLQRCQAAKTTPETKTMESKLVESLVLFTDKPPKVTEQEKREWIRHHREDPCFWSTFETEHDFLITFHLPSLCTWAILSWTVSAFSISCFWAAIICWRQRAVSKPW